MGDNLKDAEEKFRAIFENASLGILMINDKGKIILANHFLVRQFHYDSPDELMGKGWKYCSRQNSGKNITTTGESIWKAPKRARWGQAGIYLA